MRIRKEIAIDGREHHAGQCAELQHTADHCLPSGLESDESDGHSDPYCDRARGASFGSKGHHQGRNDDEEKLQDVGGNDDPAFAAAEVTVVPREEGASQAEGDDGGS